MLRAGDRDISQPLPQRLPRLDPPHATGGINIRRKDLHPLPLAALRLMDRHRSAMQKGRPHPRREGDERLFFLVLAFDLHDARRAHTGVFRPHHMQPRKSGPLTGSEVDDLRPLDQPPRLQIEPLLAVFQRQLDPIADQRLTFQQLVHRRTISRAERMDQPDARRIAPHQHRRARHQIALHPLGPNHPLIAARHIRHHVLEALEIHLRISQRMRQIKDRVIRLLPMHPLQLPPPCLGECLEHHPPFALHGRQLRRIAKQHQRREDLLQILELLPVQHRAFVDEADIKRLLPPFPAGDEVAAP